MPAALHMAFAAFVQRVLGVDQVTALRKKPLHAIGVAALFVGGQRNDQVTIGHITLLAEADQGSHPNCRHGLVVGSPAAPEISFLLDERERIDRPVVPARLHDVQMGEKQKRFTCARTSVTGDKVAFAWIWSKD